MRLITLCVFVELVVSINCNLIASKRVSAKLSGDFKIGVLVSVHHQPLLNKKGRFLECGEIREFYGIQRTEATFQTIDEINNNPNLLRNITLGVEVRDTCWYAPIALQQTIELIRDAISPNTKQPQAGCLKEDVAVNKSSIYPNILISVVGPASSSIALQVQNLLQLFSIPQIGYSTTLKDLSDKSRFASFMRVVPSDFYQAQALIDIVKKYQWSYVSTVFTDENYGQSGIQAFRELADDNSICIAREDSLLNNADDESFNEVLKNLNEDERANVIVCFCLGMTVRGLLSAMKRLNMSERFLIIGSDGMADRTEIVEDFEAEAVGSISIRIHSPLLDSFDSYYFGLSPFTNTRNPWFREFWEQKFDCTMPKKKPIIMFNNETIEDAYNLTEYSTTEASRPLINYCTGEEKLSDNYKQEPKLSFLKKAILTIAYGLEQLHEDLCGRNYEGVCPQMHPFNGSVFLNYLMNVSFQLNNDLVEFDSRGDPSARYDVMNYQLINGNYEFIHVADWNNGSLVFFKDLQMPNGLVESVCSKPCSAGFYKIIQTTGGKNEKECCWVCIKCEENQYLMNETYCKDCPLGTWPDEDQIECERIPIELLEWSDMSSVISVIFSLLGIFLTVLVFIIFCNFKDTPVVKSSTRELCYIIMIGMILSHVSVFAILANPTVPICIVTRTLPGISFSMIYASLLIKTNRIARLLAISKKRFPSKHLKFMSPISQVFLAGTLIMIEVGITVGLLYWEKPGVSLHFPTEKRALLTCDTSFLCTFSALSFIFFLILLCTVYAVKTRNVPENFNETKFVGFAMYTTCVIWIAFFPIYYGSELQTITKCLCISLSSIMTLIFLFFPKIYIILYHPEKNIRALFTTATTIRCHIGGHANISNKNSSSISSAHEPCSYLSDTVTASFGRSLKRTSSCQTSLEQLNVKAKVTTEASISPIHHLYEKIVCNPTSMLVDHDLLDLDLEIVEPPPAFKIQSPKSPKSPRKYKNNKIYTKEPLVRKNYCYYGNLDSAKKPTSTKPVIVGVQRKLSKHQKIRKTESKKIHLCNDCLELEKNRRLLKKFDFSELNGNNFNRPIYQHNPPIYTIPPPILLTQEKKAPIYEESLSECSLSEHADYKLKRITINLK